MSHDDDDAVRCEISYEAGVEFALTGATKDEAKKQALRGSSHPSSFMDGYYDRAAELEDEDLMLIDDEDDE